MTVRDAMDELNKALHLKNCHAEFVTGRYLTEEMCNSDAPHNLMKQTFDWRYDFIKPKKDKYTVELSYEAKQMAIKALEQEPKTGQSEEVNG